MNRRYLRVVVLTFAVGISTWYVGRAQDANLAVQPFSAEKSITSFAVDGTYSVTRLQHYAIQGDGSQAIWMTQTDALGQPKTHKTVYDVASSVRTAADDLTETYIVFPKKRMAHSLNHRIKVCLGQPTEPERIHGYEVVRTEEVTAIPTESGDNLKTVAYHAPALNCYTLKEEAYKSRGDGPLVLVEVKEAAEIIEGEPDPAVFELPVGYTERTPIETLVEFGRRYPDKAMSAEKLEKLRHLDDAHRMANAGG